MTDDDAKLFRELVGDVNPLRADVVAPARSKPRPRPRQRELDEQAVLAESLLGPDDVELETGEELLFARPGIQHGTMRRLRRGQLSVQGALDLHGMTADIARLAVAGFLRDALARNLRCVRIVHGKGRGSKNGKPVLKQKVAMWLRKRDEVLAYTSARPQDGGTGAIYVLLRRAEQSG